MSSFFDRLLYLLHNCKIPGGCQIGDKTKLGHSGLSVVIHRDAKIGNHCLIGQCSTIGGKSGEGPPIIEDNVFIGPGARILGDVRIGHDSVIGANAVVIDNVKPYSVVAGIPAKLITRVRKDNFKKKYQHYYGPKKYLKDKQ